MFLSNAQKYLFTNNYDTICVIVDGFMFVKYLWNNTSLCEWFDQHFFYNIKCVHSERICGDWTNVL